MNAGMLRAADVRRAFRIIGDCRDVGSNPSEWQTVAMAGVCRLVGASAATGGEGRWLRPSHPLEAVTSHSHGLNDAEQARLFVYMREFGVNADPIFQALQHVPARVVIRRRTELVSDRAWYGSKAFNEYRRSCDADHQLTSLVQVTPTGATSCLALHRSVGDRDFSDRECALASLFHVELGRLIGRSLTSALDDHSTSLSPRLRQTLACLLEGDSEKQVASRLGISQTTAHQYVTMLYRRYAVHSRAQLISRILRQRPSDSSV